MSRWLVDLQGDSVADVGCGTGNLILAYLRELGRDKARALIKAGKLHLYDLDETALLICRYSISIIYGVDLLDSINTHCSDFLSKDVVLPQNCKVISNPPYAKFSVILSDWEGTDVQHDTKELYAAFFEKIIKNAKSAVIITPYSFCGSKKFFALRRILNEHSGFIVSFDNVPANIFCGRKHGIFNTNHANSVRASITVVKDSDAKGFRLSPLLRFASLERPKLLNNGVLEDFLGENYQKIDKENNKYRKCFRSVEKVVEAWRSASTETIADLIQPEPNEFKIDIPNTCRYYCVAAKRSLSRTGKYVVYAKSQACFDYLYAFINSSFLYQQWRMLDGGITLTRELLETTPTFFKLLKKSDFVALREEVKNVSAKEDEYLVYKKNANVLQENVKFPISIRNVFNDFLIRCLGADCSPDVFRVVHSNCVFGGVDDE